MTNPTTGVTTLSAPMNARAVELYTQGVPMEAMVDILTVEFPDEHPHDVDVAVVEAVHHKEDQYDKAREQEGAE